MINASLPTHLSKLPVSKKSNPLDINDYFPQSLSIYPGTSFEMEQVLPAQAKEISADFKVYFELKGDFDGVILAQLDSSTLIEEDKNFIQGLFLEGVNIIAGQILTVIDSDHNLTALLSNPKRLADGADFHSYYNINKALYFLNFKGKELPFTLSFFTILNTPREV